MITQCEIRKLYLRKNEPDMNKIIDFAKTLERRRCGHLPEEYPEPLSTMDCMKAVVDPKGNLVNKHRYCVASQSADVRRMLREIPGVPQIYIKRSVMILEPMATESQEIRTKEEKSKFRDGIVRPERKRKREDEDEDEKPTNDGAAANGSPEKPKKKKKGPKGPNPLAVKKPKKNTEAEQKHKNEAKPEAKPAPAGDGEGDAPTKKKRKRRHRPHTGANDAAATTTTTGASASQGEQGSTEQVAGSP